MRVQVGDVRLFVEVMGPEWVLDGDQFRHRSVVVGLHGGPGLDGSVLRYNLAPVAEYAMTVIPDQRGHGRSDYSDPSHWTVNQWTEDIERLFVALGLDRPVLLGTSFGGFVAQSLAARYPDSVSGLILVSTAARMGRLEEVMGRLRLIGGDEAAEIMKRDWEQPSAVTAADFERVIAPLMSLRPESPKLSSLRAHRTRTMDVNRHFMRQARTMDLRAELAFVRCPTLVIIGEKDPLIGAALAEEVITSIPSGQAHLEILRHASHEVFNDQPEAVHRILRRFIERLLGEDRAETQ